MISSGESAVIDAEDGGPVTRVHIHEGGLDGGSLDGRVSVTSGLCLARELPDDAGPFAFLEEALAPAGPWRDATPDERCSLRPAERDEADVDIVLARFPTIAERTAEHLAACAGDLQATLDAVTRPEFMVALHAGIDEIIPFLSRAADLVFQGTCVRQGGERLVTPNLVLVPHRRIGLHVDNWDDRPLLERGSGRKRLCINIGSSPRYFLFLRCTLSALVAAKQVPPAVPPGRSPAFLVRKYLRAHMNQTVFRLRVDPGEGYIVNAEDILHDASTEGSSALDVTLQFLGYFGPGRGELVDE